MQPVCDYNGKKYIRFGERNNCGQCCIGWGSGACPNLEIVEYGKSRCKIHDRLGTDWAQKEYEAGRIPCNPSGSILFPDSPQALVGTPALLNSCSYYFIEIEKVLVACPTYDGKEYCMEEYLDSIQNLDYSFYDILLVDTSDDIAFYERWKNKVNIIHIDTIGETPYKKIALGMEYIRKYTIENKYDRWMNIEADVIVPPETITTFLSYDNDKSIDWISHSYPDRIKAGNVMDGFGCTMFSRNIIKKESFADAPSDTTTDGWYWNAKIKVKKYKVIDLQGILKLEHRNGNNTSRDTNHIW